MGCKSIKSHDPIHFTIKLRKGGIGIAGVGLWHSGCWSRHFVPAFGRARVSSSDAPPRRLPPRRPSSLCHGAAVQISRRSYFSHRASLSFARVNQQGYNGLRWGWAKTSSSAHVKRLKWFASFWRQIYFSL
jgi:hypothetical protein